jgi:inner membrane protein
MPSALSHPAAALAIPAYFGRDRLSRSAVVAGVVCSALPDVDVLGFDLGIPCDGLFGHRGLTHSFLFFLVLAVAVAALVHVRDPGKSLGDLCLYLFLATASHGVFDALTNGGRGIAFFAPFSSTRYFFRFRPIEVSPISVTRFFSERGWRVLVSELYWVWLPSAAFAGLALLARRARSKRFRGHNNSWANSAAP